MGRSIRRQPLPDDRHTLGPRTVAVDHHLHGLARQRPDDDTEFTEITDLHPGNGQDPITDLQIDGLGCRAGHHLADHPAIRIRRAHHAVQHEQQQESHAEVRGRASQGHGQAPGV